MVLAVPREVYGKLYVLRDRTELNDNLLSCGNVCDYI